MDEVKPDFPSLRFASIAPWVWQRLADLPRTGWQKRKVKGPESVKEHTVALMVLAAEVAPFSGPVLQELLDLLEVHDWPEAINGDEVIAMADLEERKRLKAIKAAKEKEAMMQICAPLGTEGAAIMNFWLRFEHSEDEVASFARQLDKYQAVEKSLEYEKEQGIPMFGEFLSYALDYVTHPILLRKLAELKEKWEA